jgi:hypothetical protein
MAAATAMRALSLSDHVRHSGAALDAPARGRAGFTVSLDGAHRIDDEWSGAHYRRNRRRSQFRAGLRNGPFFLIAISLHFATKHSRPLDSLSAKAYGLYLVHYNFVVWLQHVLQGAALFAVIKAAIVFGGTVVLSWIAVLAVQRIPFGARLIGAPRRAVATS